MTECDTVEINTALNEILGNLLHHVNDIEERAVKTEEFKDVTSNDIHVIDVIGLGQPKNMTAVAKELGVTTGTLTISVNSLVKKGFVQRVRSEEDRRVVLVSLSSKGIRAYRHHKEYHDKMINAIVSQMNDEEKKVLYQALKNLDDFFGGILKHK